MKRKKHLRILTAIFCMMLLFSAISPIHSFAFNEIPENEAQENEIQSQESEASVPNGEDINFFETLYDSFSENLSEILSALAFIGSLIIMLCYKKGFLPILTDGIKALASGVKSIGEKAESINTGATELTEKISERLTNSEQLLNKMSCKLTELTERLSNEEKNNQERAQLKTVLSAEIDMLYEIFMAAALPQYLKDNIGAKITAMKLKLGEEATGEAEN